MAEQRKGRKRRGSQRARSASRRPPLRSLWIAPGLVVAAALATLLVDRETGIVPLLELRAEAARVESQVEALEADRERLRARVVALQTDPLEIEALARERLGMVRPGERVVRLAGPD